jgi:hypothetical protein
MEELALLLKLRLLLVRRVGSSSSNNNADDAKMLAAAPELVRRAYELLVSCLCLVDGVTYTQQHSECIEAAFAVLYQREAPETGYALAILAIAAQFLPNAFEVLRSEARDAFVEEEQRKTTKEEQKKTTAGAASIAVESFRIFVECVGIGGGAAAAATNDDDASVAVNALALLNVLIRRCPATVRKSFLASLDALGLFRRVSSCSSSSSSYEPLQTQLALFADATALYTPVFRPPTLHPAKSSSSSGSSSGTTPRRAIAAAQRLSQRLGGCIVVLVETSAPAHYVVTRGALSLRVHCGHAMVHRLPHATFLLSALLAAFLSTKKSSSSAPLDLCVAAVCLFGRAVQRAAERSEHGGVGSFLSCFNDALYSVHGASLAPFVRITKQQ